MHVYCSLLGLAATFDSSWTIGNDFMRTRFSSAMPDSIGKRYGRWLKLVDTEGCIFAILAVSLIVVNIALICILNKHANKNKIRLLIYWSATFTLTYGLRAGFQFLFSNNAKWFITSFIGNLINYLAILLWDLPAILSTLVLNHKLLKETIGLEKLQQD